MYMRHNQYVKVTHPLIKEQKKNQKPLSPPLSQYHAEIILII